MPKCIVAAWETVSFVSAYVLFACLARALARRDSRGCMCGAGMQSCQQQPQLERPKVRLVKAVESAARARKSDKHDVLAWFGMFDLVEQCRRWRTHVHRLLSGRRQRR